MKKYYYFSEKSLEFVEIKNFKTRLLFYLSLVSIFFSVIVFSGFFLLSSFTSSRVDLASIKKENTFLKSKVIDLTKQFRSFKANLEDLDNKTENLRIAANLEPISEDE